MGTKARRWLLHARAGALGTGNPEVASFRVSKENDGADALALVHDVEGLVDLVQGVGEGDVLVHLELTLQVLLYDQRTPRCEKLEHRE